MKKKIGNIVLDYTFYTGKDRYNEGDEVEEFILRTVQETDDYTDALAADTRWPVLYQLSKQRELIVEPMEIKNTDFVLEIGAGMGAVTGALACQAQRVDCIELSERRSLANAHRNKSMNNINIFIGNFQDIKLSEQYDVVTLIGVLEYAKSYIGGATPYEHFLKRIAGYMKPNGKLYIAIENKLGLKYFAGCMEDHTGQPFIGIEGYNKESPAKTFSKSQIEQLLINTGFQNLYFYYPYPDYKMPTVIYSDDHALDDSFIMGGFSNYDQERLVCFDEEKTYKSLIGAEELKMLSNSFLIKAEKK